MAYAAGALLGDTSHEQGTGLDSPYLPLIVNADNITLPERRGHCTAPEDIIMEINP
jgi:hypothetical protein